VVQEEPIQVSGLGVSNEEIASGPELCSSESRGQLKRTTLKNKEI